MIANDLLMGILLLAPVLGFLVNGIRAQTRGHLLPGLLATGAAGISFICAVGFFMQILKLPPESRTIVVHYFDWIKVGDFTAPMSFVIDQISIVMLLVITGVGSLIHLFSIGYMSHDKTPSKYFCYLNLFLFNMLLLVLGENLLVMFIGWEGVGLCSYLLIGYWFTDADKATAGMKAFITNRIGDAGLLIGIFILYSYFGTLAFGEMAARVPASPEVGWTGALTLACLTLFVGACGKSAQIPLYVWLPDAMAGPTPVSALIHAATMVTAGVYMIVRMNSVFMVAPNAMLVVAIVGAATAIVAATIGITQWDIKKVLAYSTVSQLGYMFLGVGVGAFVPAMFHLVTHAFFKALMFLGSGSVIHAMHEEQDMRKMGGLRKLLPITHATFFVGWLAIIGMPPFAGFFSKDEILWYSFASPQGHHLLWVVGAIAALCTAFYMTRLMCLTFWSKPRFGKSAHPHESPLVMTVPLIVLGILSFVGGWVGIPHLIGEILPGHPGNLFEAFLEPLVKMPKVEASHTVEWSLMGVSVALAGIGATVAFFMYITREGLAATVAKALGPIDRLVSNKYFVDEIYFAGIIGPVVNLSKALWFYFDVNFIDRITHVVTGVITDSGKVSAKMQSGNLQTYALAMVVGFVAALIFVLVR